MPVHSCALTLCYIDEFKLEMVQTTVADAPSPTKP